MAMTIKNERVINKIRLLAERLEIDRIGAVERAVDALADQLPASEMEVRLKRALDQVDTIRRSLSTDLNTDELYDDAGLPA